MSNSYHQNQTLSASLSKNVNHDYEILYFEIEIINNEQI